MATSQAKQKSNSKVQRRLAAPERRKLILQAAQTVFMQRGYAGARTKDIAQQAGINEALIYQHFKSKEELFDAAVLDPLEEWLAQYDHASPAISSAKTVEDQKATLERNAIEYSRQIASILPMLTIALLATGQHGYDFYQSRLVPFIEKYAKE